MIHESRMSFIRTLSACFSLPHCSRRVLMHSIDSQPFWYFHHSDTNLNVQPLKCENGAERVHGHFRPWPSSCLLNWLSVLSLIFSIVSVSFVGFAFANIENHPLASFDYYITEASFRIYTRSIKPHRFLDCV